MKKLIALMLVSLSVTSAATYACTEAGGDSAKCQKICAQFSHFNDNSYGACMIGATHKSL